MHNIGVIGLGMMGATHLDVYSRRTDARVVAVADTDPDRRSGKSVATGNVKGQAQGLFDFTKVKQFAEGMDLINDPEIDVVDICLITPLHLPFAIAAAKAGKNLIIEKPLARTSADALAMADAVDAAGVIAMPAMCMRFWPGWVWLKEAIDGGTYGKLLSAHFRRLATHPGGRFYADGAASGGALLDLHLHDTDFVHFCFGMPSAVQSRGYSSVTNGVDHVTTQYIYENGPAITAEGGWAMQQGFPFTMQYMANFEGATACFDIGATPQLTLYVQGRDPAPVAIPTVMGYEVEIDYFLNCVAAGKKPTTVTLRDAAAAIRITEAEGESVRTGKAVTPG